jgi:uncharacterized membrane protein
MDFGSIMEDFLKGIVLSVIILVIVISAIVSFATFKITKNTYSKEAVEQKELYEQTVKELSPKQREVLGL